MCVCLCVFAEDGMCVGGWLGGCSGGMVWWVGSGEKGVRFRGERE